MILSQPAKFRLNQMIAGGVMTSYRFFKMAAIKSEIYFRFRFRNGTRLRKWISICKPNFDEIGLSPSTAKINFFRFRKTDGCHIEIVLPVSILTTYSHRQVILHQPVKFRRNRTLGGEVMTSYRVFKMAAIEWEIYFRVWFW